MKRLRTILILLVLAAAASAVYIFELRPGPLVLTGIVTTDDVVVSPQIAGQVTQLLARAGDSVDRDQLLAVIAPDELKAEVTYYAQSAEGLAGQVRERARRRSRSSRSSRRFSRFNRQGRSLPPPKRRGSKPPPTSRTPRRNTNGPRRSPSREH